MAQCPLCQAPVQSDFGLVECESCGAQLLVHVDGQVEHQGAAIDADPPVQAEVEAESEEMAFAGTEDDSEHQQLQQEQSEEEQEPAPETYQAGAMDSPDLSDVASFGNSDLSGGRDGALRYTLFIDGIDTSDVREAFREALTDRKFVWDTDAILRSVRNGEVVIENVAPSKAFILISRLRGLPVRVQWEQHAIHQS